MAHDQGVVLHKSACLLIVIGDADVCDQQNALHWECINPTWVLRDYVGELAQALQVTKAWIVTSGVAASTTVVTDVPAHANNASDSESEVPGSEDTPQEELPTPCQLLPKMLQSDQVEHTIDKGVWAAMPATCQGWKIFIVVSDRSFFFVPSLIFHAQGQLMRHNLIFQHCVTICSHC